MSRKRSAISILRGWNTEKGNEQNLTAEGAEQEQQHIAGTRQDTLSPVQR